MNKTVIWVIAAVVVIGGAAYFIMNGSGASSASGTAASSTAPTSQTQSSGTMKDLLAHGSSECQVNDPKSGASGTVYVGDGKMRADFTTLSSSGTIASHMISDGQTIYVWSSAMPQGMKMAVSASSQASSSSASSQDPYNENVNYTCSAWSVESSEFALPAGITFEDMTSLQGGGNAAPAGAATTGNAAACSACGRAPSAAAQAQCKAALGCK